jgi:hypothetical protein
VPNARQDFGLLHALRTVETLLIEAIAIGTCQSAAAERAELLMPVVRGPVPAVRPRMEL